MTITALYISGAIIAALVSSAAAFYLGKRTNRSQPGEHVPEGSLMKLQDQVEENSKLIRQLQQEMNGFTLKSSELEEFVTRGMNRMSARHAKMTKKEEEQQMQEELQRQAQLLNGTDEEEELEDPNYRPRLMRRGK